MSDIISNIKEEELNSFFPICNKCKNHIDGLICKAFIIIPDDIIFGKNNHSKPLPNQNNNVIFEPLEND